MCVVVRLEINVCYGYSVWCTFSNKHIKRTVNDNKRVRLGVQTLMKTHVYYTVVYIYLCLAASERFCKVEMIDHVVWISWSFFVLSLPWFSFSFLIHLSGTCRLVSFSHPILHNHVHYLMVWPRVHWWAYCRHCRWCFHVRHLMVWLRGAYCTWCR